ncbi:hypothetical protein JD844_015410 [Phrynosoma platyrhinos]|uniref:Tetratricopeptide repeat domain 23 n=1 Tax=Phrynosoma platyrhinos TaxID=52577 RepID=A0ABQ7SJ42_PHRPL|nr:hypothetical protein JD844_015410 [Phrynosoma platyrhinos]
MPCPLELQKDKEKAQRKGDLKEEAALCNQLGSILARHGECSPGLDPVIQKPLAPLLDQGIYQRPRESFPFMLLSISWQHQRLHLELACSVSSHIEQQRAWATIGRTYMFMAESDQSREALQEAEKAFMKSLAIVEEKLEGTKAKARWEVIGGKGDAQQTQLFEDLYRAYYNLGNIHLREGQHSKAMRCLERARECACKMKEKYMESECCAGIAQVTPHISLGFWPVLTCCISLQVLLSLGDFVAAKRSLKKAYRLGSQQPQQRESICQSLRYVSKVSRLQQALEEAEVTANLEAALSLCEQLGDLFSKAGDYQRSVEAYEKQVRPSHCEEWSGAG